MSCCPPSFNCRNFNAHAHIVPLCRHGMYTLSIICRSKDVFKQQGKINFAGSAFFKRFCSVESKATIVGHTPLLLLMHTMQHIALHISKETLSPSPMTIGLNVSSNFIATKDDCVCMEEFLHFVLILLTNLSSLPL